MTLLNDFSLTDVATNAASTTAVATSRKSSGLLNSDGSITQSERLLTARARYGATKFLTGESSDLGGQRGQWGYLKLMTSDAQAKAYAAGDNSRNLSFKDDLLSEILPNMSDPTGGNTYGYDRFLITSVSGQMIEKVQVMEVFGDNEVYYYFGRRPLAFTISGILIDSPDNSWFSEWLMLYSDVLRGTQLAKNYELIRLVLPNMILTGTITGFSWAQNSARDIDIPFTFEFAAKEVQPIPATNLSMPTSPNLKFVDFTKGVNFTGQEDINNLKGQVATLQGVLQDPTSSIAQKAAAMQALGSTTGSAFDIAMQNANSTLTGFQSTINGWDASRATFFNSVQNSSMFQTVTSTLTGIRLNLFSPVYGIMSSLTKLVTNTANSAINLLGSVITPVRNILRDITNISNQAVALVNLVNSSISGIGRAITGSLKGVATDFETAIHSLGKAAGAIATAPITTAQAVASMFSNSTLSYNAPFLTVPAKLTFSRPSLTVNGTITPTPKATLLRNIATYDPAVATL